MFEALSCAKEGTVVSCASSPCEKPISCLRPRRMAQAVVARAAASGLVGFTGTQAVLSQKSTYLSGSRSVLCRSNAGSAKVSMRASWLPGSKLPEYLDGLPG